MRDLPKHAAALVSSLEDRGVRTRLFGGVAVALLTDYRALFGEERKAKDIDLITDLPSFMPARRALGELGYVANRRELYRAAGTKATFWDPAARLQVDLYCDPLLFSHRVVLGARLFLTSPTITPTDLLVTKLQIHSITDGDMRDMAALLSLSCGSDEERTMSPQRLASICSADWGLYHTSVSNIEILLRFLNGGRSLISDTRVIIDSARMILEAVGTAPKSIRWRLRGCIGTRIAWYNEPE